MRRISILFAAVMLASASIRADDRWESGTGGGDDNSASPNALVHGRAQVHDLEGSGATPDVDWVRFGVRARQSYEVRIFSSTVFFVSPGPPVCQSGFCASLDRVLSDGTVLQSAAATEGDKHVATMRWTALSDGLDFVRVTGGSGAWTTADEYTMELTNTTVFIPRFNNSASQTTVLILQNTQTVPVNASIDFWSPSGVRLFTQDAAIAGHGVFVLSSASLPALQGESGSVSISHGGTYGAIVGKGVALEPATGYTFDTPSYVLPR